MSQPGITDDHFINDPAPFRPGALLAALERHGVDYVLIGGLAAQVHGSHRVTRGVDITPNPHGPNLDHLRNALVELGAREYVPGFGYPLQMPMHRRRLSTEATLRTATRFGPLDVIPKPHGFDGGYAEIAHRLRHRYAYGLMVPVADMEDLQRSHAAGGRAKDAACLAHLRDLDRQIRGAGLLPVFEQDPSERAPSFEVATSDRQSIQDALDAATALAKVFDDIRPAMAAARRQLYQAVDDLEYGDETVLAKRLRIARSAVDAAYADLVEIRRDLQPEATDRQLAEPPMSFGRADSTAVLAYQAYEETCVTRRILVELADFDVHRPEGRDLLIEARIHAATADANLDLLQIQLERTARAWETPQHDQVDGPEI